MIVSLLKSLYTLLLVEVVVKVAKRHYCEYRRRVLFFTFISTVSKL